MDIILDFFFRPPKTSRNSIGGGRRLSAARKNRLKRGNSKIKTNGASSVAGGGQGQPYKPARQPSDSRASAAGAGAAAQPARRSSTGTPTKLRRSKTSEDISDNGDDQASLLHRQFIDEIVATSLSIENL